MLTAYLSTLFIGGALLMLSIFAGGDHEMDHGTEFDSDFDGDIDADFDADVDMDAHSGGLDFHGFDAWLPIGSLRFWTFFSAFFGLVGTSLTFAGSLGSTLTLAPSIGVGYVSGVVATRLLKKLTKESVGKVVNARDLVGTIGQLMLPVAPGVQGKVRMNVGGRTVEQPAYCDEEIKAGSKALIISVHEDGGVWVSPAPLLED
jgi:membrane protein implicated in regulation of membrane protease activity